MRRLVVGLLVGLAALAGCIGQEADLEASEADEQAVVWDEKALPFGSGHDHTEPSDHANRSTDNFEVVGSNPLHSPFYDAPAGSYFCGDAKPTEDDRRLGVVESRSQVGFAIADVTDPQDPKWLGELVMRATYVYDVAMAPDGEHVLLATSDANEGAVTETVPGERGLAPQESQDAGMVWNSPCNGEPVPVTAADSEEDPVPRPMSVVLVDISDPEQPEVVEQQPIAGSGHSVWTERIDGRDWVMVTTSRTPAPVGVPVVNNNAISMYHFYELDSNASSLEPLSVFQQPTEDPAERPLGPRGHDGWMNVHPETGEVTAYLAGGDRFTVLDMSDPREPEETGRWTVTGPGTPANEGTLHGAYPIDESWDGSHYTIVGPEHAGHPETYPSGIVWVLDTTDPSAIEPVAAWTLPAQVDWNGTYMFSPHYFTHHGETLFVSMYHGGMWAVDLSPLEGEVDTSDGLVQLDSVGVWINDEAPEEEPAVRQRWTPTLEEALAMPDGTVTTFDGNAGVYSVDFDEDDPAPAPDPWPIHDPRPAGE